MKRVDELILGSVGYELMHRVVGKVDKLIRCGNVEKVDELAQRRRGESK